ncbi:MAG: hypothetical protein WAU60_02580 [Candidatus Competibacter denitrificans]|jgi:hypothetical protein|nr:hypothetical protein [Candidatus Competibacter denitrificans]HRC69001.1 hypothetical protein [Candidatus Competibacter denitrificans]
MQWVLRESRVFAIAAIFLRVGGWLRQPLSDDAREFLRQSNDLPVTG